MSNVFEPHSLPESFSGQNKILKAIDMDEWKHSWHLPENWKTDVSMLEGITKILNDKILNRKEEIARLEEAYRLTKARMAEFIKEKKLDQ